jgi:hypothetical protein
MQRTTCDIATYNMRHATYNMRHCNVQDATCNHQRLYSRRTDGNATPAADCCGETDGPRRWPPFQADPMAIESIGRYGIPARLALPRRYGIPLPARGATTALAADCPAHDSRWRTRLTPSHRHRRRLHVPRPARPAPVRARAGGRSPCLVCLCGCLFVWLFGLVCLVGWLVGWLSGTACVLLVRSRVRRRCGAGGRRRRRCTLYGVCTAQARVAR